MTDIPNFDREKKKLLQEIQQADSIESVLKLAIEFSKADTKKVRFSVDSSIISRLGEELVVKQETAVAELIKNAYDADATEVNVLFQDTDKPGGNLIIQDNGIGMTREELVYGFMRLSSMDKITNPISINYKRKKAGKKGIGRFAAQRIGKKLILITQTKKSNVALRVEIDWDKYQGYDEISFISNEIEEISKLKPEGTDVIIEDLRESWTNAQITRVYRYIMDLQLPFPVSKRRKENKSDPGFVTILEQVVSDEIETIASLDKIVYESALAEIDGYLDEKNELIIELKSKTLDFSTPIDIPDELDFDISVLKNVHLKAYYYITGRGKSSIPRNLKTSIEGFLREQGGVRIYRNGFRVLPYGEKDNDWLGLELIASRRTILPPFSNRNFLAIVEIIDEETIPIFKETSSREGLVENKAYYDLQKFVLLILQTAIIRVAEERGRKIFPSDKKEERDEKSETIEDLSVVTEGLTEKVLQSSQQDLLNLIEEIQDLETIITEEAERKKDADESDDQKFGEKVSDIKSERAKEIISKYLELLGMYRILASLGLTIGEFTHEIKLLLPPILADLNSIRKLTKNEKELEIIDRLFTNVNHFKTFTAIFDRAVSSNVKRELGPQEIGQILRVFEDAVKPSALRYGIDFKPAEIKGYDLFTTPMHPSEWVSILFNLYSNSVKAIRRRGSTNGVIKIVAYKDADHIFIEFSDNGDGIAEANQERIFNAFYTTTTPNSISEADDKANESEDLTGSGLGLTIIRDIISSYRGIIEIIGSKEGYSTTFRIEIPIATPEEVKDYGY